MSKNIPITDEIFYDFISMKEAIGKITNNKKLTNDSFITMLIEKFPLRKKAMEYIEKDKLTIEEINNGNNGKVK